MLTMIKRHLFAGETVAALSKRGDVMWCLWRKLRSIQETPVMNPSQSIFGGCVGAWTHQPKQEIRDQSIVQRIV